MNREQQIITWVQASASRHGRFTKKWGPGEGNKITNRIMKEVEALVGTELGACIAEQKLTPHSDQSVDYWLEAERTVIEVEFSLSNPAAVLQKDMLKVMLGIEAGRKIDRLVLVGGPGSERRLDLPSAQEVIGFAKRQFRVHVVVHELTV